MKLVLSRKRDTGKGSNFLPPVELFEQIMLPHLDSAYNLARWITRSDQDAQDVVQEAFLRAFRFFDSFRGGDGKAWLLEIVRNTSHTWLRRQSRTAGMEPFDEAAHSGASHGASPEQVAAGREELQLLRGCIEALPVEFREVLIMRELEEMSYRDIGEATGLAPGTVMSRLARARKRLEECAGKRVLEAVR
jgi:RNA polymerase sigma-70 factor (ECF subfamily)